MDNLQSMTYEMFEKDPIKYAQYEKVSSSRLMIIGLIEFHTVRIPCSL